MDFNYVFIENKKVVNINSKVTELHYYTIINELLKVYRNNIKIYIDRYVVELENEYLRLEFRIKNGGKEFSIQGIYDIKLDNYFSEGDRHENN